MATRFSAAAGAYTIAPKLFRWLYPPSPLDLLLPTLERLESSLVGFNLSPRFCSALNDDDDGDKDSEDEDDVPSTISNELASADIDK